MPPVPKPNHKRLIPTQKSRNEFSGSVRKQIEKRSGGVCEYCGKARATQKHHILPKGRHGRGLATNGMDMCYECHKIPHDDESIMQELIEMYTQKYGKNFYKDEWDFHY